jgi:hypothetical protein
MRICANIRYDFLVRKFSPLHFQQVIKNIHPQVSSANTTGHLNSLHSE